MSLLSQIKNLFNLESSELNVSECCKDKNNLHTTPNKNGTKVESCQVCGRNHVKLKAEAGDSKRKKDKE